MNKIYTLEEINVLVNKYRETEKNEYISEIFRAFEGFIYKYVHFLKFGKYKESDRDLIKLLGFFTGKHENPIYYIKKTFDSWEYEDVLNELNYLFIKMVHQFIQTKNTTSFTGFIYHHYKFIVKTLIQKTSKDVMNSMLKIEYLDEVDFMESLEDPTPTKYENICLLKKTDLNQLEKYIIYLHYGKKISINTIAQMLGLDRSSINILKKQAKSKLISSGITLQDLEKH